MIPYDLMKKNPWKEKFFYSEKCMDTKDVYNHGKKRVFTTMEKRMFATMEKRVFKTMEKKGCIQPWKKRVFTTMEIKDF